jgi:hypothetical protein
MSEEEKKEENQKTEALEIAFFGKLSFWLAIGGIVVLAFMLLMEVVRSLTDHETLNIGFFFGILYLLHRAMEVGALVTGIFGFRSGYGKAGLIISAIMLIGIVEHSIYLARTTL